MIKFARMTSRAGHRKFVIILGYSIWQKFYLSTFRGYQVGRSARRVGAILDFDHIGHESTVQWIEEINFLFKPGAVYIKNVIKDKL